MLSVKEVAFLLHKASHFNAIQTQELLWNSGIDFFTSSDSQAAPLTLMLVKTLVVSGIFVLKSIQKTRMVYQASLTCVKS